ncbi:Hypothetical protein A7982_02568 [Minicystis rosea]|nr:Hypothetical protein A7982_02568 [Minicystis rosea]
MSAIAADGVAVTDASAPPAGPTEGKGDALATGEASLLAAPGSLAGGASF